MSETINIEMNRFNGTDYDILLPSTVASAVTYGATNVEQALNSLIASGSAPYSETSTYAIGAYCNQLGVMYKCTTAITSPEAWNAAHWTATTVAAELLAIDASLSNKVNWSEEALTTDVLEWALEQTAPTSIFVLPNTPNSPDSGRYLYLSVTQFYCGNIELTAVEAWESTVWKNSFTGNTWKGWVKLATATDLVTKQDVSTAINTSNIASQTVNTATYAVYSKQSLAANTLGLRNEQFSGGTYTPVQNNAICWTYG